MDLGRAAQMPFVLGGLLGEDMALERHGAFDAPASSHAEAFLRSALSLHLGHDCIPYLLPAAVFSGGESLGPAWGFFTCCGFTAVFFGASSITICRPSRRGQDSTTLCGSRSVRIRSNKRTPNS